MGRWDVVLNGDLEMEEEVGGVYRMAVRVDDDDDDGKPEERDWLWL